MASASPLVPPSEGKQHDSIVDDFMYGSNVATAHVYVRMGFLRKVYGILSAQLFVTTLVGVIFMMHEGTKQFVRANQWMLLLAFVGTLGMLIALQVKRKEYPANFILLSVFTLLEAYTVGVVVTFYDKQVVLEAFLLTFAVTAGLTIYTLQSKKDYSSWGAGLFAALWVLIIAGLLQLFIPAPMLDKGIAVAGAILFSLFIVYDTSMIMHRVSPEEYILASINLYLDILNLFMHILRILGEARRN